jgi:hypothetical protein
MMGWILGFIIAPLLVGALLVFLFATRANWVASHKRQLVWLFILVLLAIIFYSLLGESVVGLLGPMRDEMAQFLADPPVWVNLLGMGIVGFVVLLVFRRNEGLQSLKMVAAFLVTIAIFGFIIDKLNAEQSAGPRCSTAKVAFATDITEQRRLVSLPPGELYEVDVPLGSEFSLVYEWADTPFPEGPSLDFGPVEDYLFKGEYGEPAGERKLNGKGLTGGKVLLGTNWEAYRTTVGNKCLDYYVYLNRSENSTEVVGPPAPESE